MGHCSRGESCFKMKTRTWARVYAPGSSLLEQGMAFRIGRKTKECGAGYQDVGPGGHQFGGVVRGHAPVHLDVQAGVVLVGQGAQFADLADGEGNELLPAKAGIHAHEQHHVQLGQQVFDHGQGRMRIERHGGLGPQPGDFRHGAFQVRGGLGMHAHQIRARVHELGQIALGPLNHQVHVEEETALLAQRLDDGWTQGDVGDEKPIHDIPMHPPDTSGFKSGQFLGKPAEIGGKQGRGKDKFVCHAAAPSGASLP